MISAQIQGVPSEQKPQGSRGARAGIEEVLETVVRAGGGRRENWAVKSISAFSCSGSKSGFEVWQTRLVFVLDGGEWGRLKAMADMSADVVSSIPNASSMHWHLVSTLH